MFQIIYFRHNRHLPVSYISSQRINYFELTLILEGNVEYLLNDISCPAQKGDIIFVNPQMVRERKAIANAEYVSFNFISTTEVYNIPVIQNNAITDTISLLLKGFEYIYNESLNFSDERLSLLLQCILLKIKHEDKQNKEHPLVTEIKKFIKARLKEKITLDTISKITFFSPSYCEMIFKRETGKGIIDYLLDKRISLAKALIHENISSLTEIAREVGFSDYNYFARTFKKRTGYTPTQYIKSTIS